MSCVYRKIRSEAFCREEAEQSSRGAISQLMCNEGHAFFFSLRTAAGCRATYNFCLASFAAALATAVYSSAQCMCLEHGATSQGIRPLVGFDRRGATNFIFIYRCLSDVVLCPSLGTQPQLFIALDTSLAWHRNLRYIRTAWKQRG